MNVIGNGAPILMLDDDATDRSIAKACYARTGLRNEFITLDSAKAFFDYFSDSQVGKKNIPELVLLDINMPDVDGFETLLRLRAIPEFKDLPIAVFLSNSSSERDKQRAKDLGSKAYFTKPGDIREYVKIFQNLSSLI